MIVLRSGHDDDEVEAKLRRVLLELARKKPAPKPRRITLAKHVDKIERQRIRTKARATTKLQAALVNALDATRAAFLRSVGVRESFPGHHDVPGVRGGSAPRVGDLASKYGVTDSHIQGTYFHGTTAENAAKIRSDGFKLASDPNRRPVHGPGIYLASESTARNYAARGTVIDRTSTSARQTPGEVVAVKVDGRFANFPRGAEYAKLAKDLAPNVSQEAQNQAVADHLRARGYDGFTIPHSAAIGNELIVLDPSKAHVNEAQRDERILFVLNAESVSAKESFREADDTPGDEQSYLDAANNMSPDEIYLALSEALKIMYEQGVVHANVEIGGSFEVDAARAKAAIDAHALQYSKKVLEEDRAALKQIIRDAFDGGSSVPQLRQAIEDYFDEGLHQKVLYSDGSLGDRTLPIDTWANTVARTEIAQAQNAGIFDLFNEAGIADVQWLSAEDERVEPLCEELDGAVTKLGESFPGTDVSQPPLHPNCRCTLVAAPGTYDLPAAESFFGHVGRPGNRGGSQARSAAGVIENYVKAWQQSSFSDSAQVLRAQVNVAQGFPHTANFTPTAKRSYEQLQSDTEEKDPATISGEAVGEVPNQPTTFGAEQSFLTENLPAYIENQQTAFAKQYPEGTTVYRGVDAKSILSQIDTLAPGDETQFSPLISASTDQKIGRSFAAGNGVVLRFDGVKGEHVFASHVAPGALGKGSMYETESEVILLGNASRWHFDGKLTTDSTTYYRFTPDDTEPIATHG